MALMSLCIFMPTLFALTLLFIPSERKEWMRWWSLIGTAANLRAQHVVFVDFQGMLDKNAQTTRNRFARILERLHLLVATPARRSRSRPANEFRHTDGFTRKSLDFAFQFEYYLGVDASACQ